MKLTALMRHPWKHQGDGTAKGFFAIGEHACDRHLKLVHLSFDCFEQSRQVSLRVLLSKGRASKISWERQSRPTQSTSWPTSGRPPVQRQDDVPLLLEACRDALLIRDRQGHQFFRALPQRGHAALRHADATCLTCLLPLRHPARFAKANLPHQRHHLPAKLAVWQREAALPPPVGRAGGSADNLAEPDFRTTRVNLHKPESIATVRWR